MHRGVPGRAGIPWWVYLVVYTRVYYLPTRVYLSYPTGCIPLLPTRVYTSHSPGDTSHSPGYTSPSPGCTSGWCMYGRVYLRVVYVRQGVPQ